MNKKLIAAALAALPVVSIADVTVYGTLNGGWQNDSTTNRSSEKRVDDYTSFIGFKGNEDLGNGVKAIWQVESRVHLDGSAPHSEPNSFGSRQTFVGLEGEFGSLRFGRLNNSLQDLGTVDPWSYNSERFAEMYTYKDFSGSPRLGFTHSGGANGLGVFTRNADRLKNALRYDSPDLSGFTAHIEYGFGENKILKKNSGQHARSSDIGSFGVNYSNNGFSGHYAYQKEYNPGSQNNDVRVSANIQRVELGYEANNLLIALGYQRAKGYDWADDFSGTGGYVANLKNAYILNTNNEVQDFIQGVKINGGSILYLGTTSAARQVLSKQAAVTVGYTIGALTPRISYAKGWNQKDNITGKINDSGYRQYVVGVDYALSKRTLTGISYGDLKWDKNTTQALQSADWSGAAIRTGKLETKDTTVRTWGVHLTHNF